MMNLGFVGFNCFDCDFDWFDDYHRKSDLFLLALVFVVVVFFCNFVVFVVDCTLRFRTNLFPYWKWVGGSLPADVLWGSFVTHSFLPHGEMNA